MKIHILNWRQNRGLAKPGNQTRQSSEVVNAPEPEIDHSKNVAEKISSVDLYMRAPAVRSYVWAKKPLRTVSIIFALIVVYGGVSCGRRPPTRGAEGSNAASPAQGAEDANALIPTATKSAALPSKPRDKDSLAVERYLRTRLIGGITDAQLVELSDAIEQEFFATPFSSTETGWCLSGEGDQRVLYLYMIKNMTERGSMSSSSSKVEAAELMDKIKNMLPPRAVFLGLFEPYPAASYKNHYKPLPAVETHIALGARPFGGLVNEHLQSLKTAIEDKLSDSGMSERAISQVRGLEERDVLVCSYQGSNDREWQELFWYKKNPDGLDRLLGTLAPDHPVHQIGPARDSAPATLALALKANPKSAEDLRRRINDAESSDRDAKLIRLLDQVLNR